MMDIEKICASLRVLPTTEELLTAEKALYALQAENEKLLNEVERQRRSADNMRHLYENAERAYINVQAELEQVKRCLEIVEHQREAAIDDMTALMAGQCCDLCAVEYCNDRGKTEMCTAFKWRGTKEG